jgi:pyruvate formate lyase activating enzyme
MRNICNGHIAPVLATLAYLAQLDDVWLEITVPLIPGENDSVGEVRRLSRWLVDELGPEVPLHLKISHLLSTRTTDQDPARPKRPRRARRIARAAGSFMSTATTSSTPLRAPRPATAAATG